MNFDRHLETGVSSEATTPWLTVAVGVMNNLRACKPPLARGKLDSEVFELWKNHQWLKSGL